MLEKSIRSSKPNHGLFVFIAKTFTRNFGNVGTRFRNRHKFIVLKYFANKTSHYEYSVIFLFYAIFGKTQGTSWKLRAIYFKISALYFKIYALYFLPQQTFDTQQLTKDAQNAANCLIFRQFRINSRNSVLIAYFSELVKIYAKILAFGNISGFSTTFSTKSNTQKNICPTFWLLSRLFIRKSA